MASIPPNQTIYVQNLYEKLPKQGEHSTPYLRLHSQEHTSCRHSLSPFVHQQQHGSSLPLATSMHHPHHLVGVQHGNIRAPA